MARTKTTRRKTTKRKTTKKSKKCGHIRKCGCTTRETIKKNPISTTKCTRCNYPKGRVTCITCGNKKRVRKTVSTTSKGNKRITITELKNTSSKANCNSSCICCNPKKNTDNICKLSCGCCFKNNNSYYTYDLNTLFKSKGYTCDTGTCKK